METLKIDPAAACSQPSTDELQRQSSRKSLILRCQRILFSAYRTDQYADPDGFLTSLGAVLEQYPNEVIIYITDPRTGVQRNSKFPPTIAEIVAAGDAHLGYLHQQKRFANWGKNDPPMIEPPRENRPSYDELKAKYGENWGINPLPDGPPKPAFKAPSKEELAAHYSQYGVGFVPRDRTNPENVAREQGETGE